MSGGQRRRVELARILFAETTTLLLDEPTNHLDMDAKGWLVAFLSDYEGGLLIVSHDLPLLDESITSVLAVEGGRIEPFRGNYSYYLEEHEQRRTQRLRERRQQEAKIARLEDGIRRFKGSSESMARRALTRETRVRRTISSTSNAIVSEWHFDSPNRSPPDAPRCGLRDLPRHTDTTSCSSTSTSTLTAENG
jgi:ATPase subunit of ABC transporter with duplicated ATPase domains